MRKKLGSRSAPADGVFREITILERLNSSDHVIKLFEVLNDIAHDHIYIGTSAAIYLCVVIRPNCILTIPFGALTAVLEYITGGSLMTLQGDNPLPEAKAKSFFCDVAKGLEYSKPMRAHKFLTRCLTEFVLVHSVGVIHRDIKPDNLLLSADGTVKICDFSVSQIFEDGEEVISSSAGSPAFLAPGSIKIYTNCLSACLISYLSFSYF